jgi:ABC-type multidrug transport system fused ATPase/permease subunit
MIGDYKYFYRIFSLLTSKLKRRIFFLLPLMAFASLFEILSLSLVLPIASMLIDPKRFDSYLHKLSLEHISNKYFIFLVALAIFLVFLIKTIFVFFVSKFGSTTAAKCKSFYQLLLYRSYLHSDYSYHWLKSTSEYIKTIIVECNILDARFLTPLVIIGSELFTLFALICFLFFVVDPFALALSIGSFLLIGFFIVKKTSNNLKKFGESQVRADQNIISLVQQSFNSIKEMKIYSLSPVLINKMEVQTDQSSQMVAKASMLNQLPRFILEINAILSLGLFAWISYINGNDRTEIAISLSVFVMAILRLLPSANRLVSHIQALNHSYSVVKNIVDTIDELNLNVLRGNQSSLSRLDINPDEFKSLELKNINFHYPGKSTLISNFGVFIKNGATIGIIGKTGAGKTTLLNILLGLINPTSGETILNGKKLNLSDIHNKKIVSYVPQDVYILDDNVWNNIKYFDEKITDAEVESALNSVGMLSFFKTMQSGLQTQLGENGSRLSGGQRQRVAIARAIARDTPIIVFDEATSSLDKETEEAITESIDNLAGKKTLIIVAHRPSSLSICDYVLNLKRAGQCEVINGDEFRRMNNLTKDGNR